MPRGAGLLLSGFADSVASPTIAWLRVLTFCESGDIPHISLLKGSWHLVPGVLNQVTILITSHNPREGTYNL